MYMEGKSLSIPLPKALKERGFTGGSRGNHNADNRIGDISIALYWNVPLIKFYQTSPQQQGHLCGILCRQYNCNLPVELALIKA